MMWIAWLAFAFGLLVGLCAGMMLIVYIQVAVQEGSSEALSKINNMGSRD